MTFRVSLLVLLLGFSLISHFVALQISWACLAFLIVYVSVQTNAALSIYMEYVSEGSIHVLLGKHGPFKESMIRNYTAQILSGLACLHERRHIHRWYTLSKTVFLFHIYHKIQ